MEALIALTASATAYMDAEIVHVEPVTSHIEDLKSHIEDATAYITHVLHAQRM